MAEDNDGQERTEEATPKRKKESREKGQVARSKEFNTMVVLVCGAFGLLLLGGSVSTQIVITFSELMDLIGGIRSQTFEIDIVFLEALKGVFFSMLPFLLGLFVLTILGALVIGGWNFSTESMAPKLERMDPISGLKKLISLKGLMELLKALLKFILVAGFSILILYLKTDSLLTLSQADVEASTHLGLSELAYFFLLLSVTTLLIAAVDVPFQLWNHAKQLKMTRQEIKDELKDTEGRPEVRGRIKQLQRTMAQSRMMDRVPAADVIVTNPTHFAVALKYDEKSMKAPIVVAKGTDLIAENIRKVGAANDVTLVAAPPLARALYYSTELEAEVPEGLYVAVAEVLAYVYQLSLYEKGRSGKPKLKEALPIPEKYRR